MVKYRNIKYCTEIVDNQKTADFIGHVSDVEAGIDHLSDSNNSQSMEKEYFRHRVSRFFLVKNTRK